MLMQILCIQNTLNLTSKWHINVVVKSFMLGRVVARVRYVKRSEILAL